MSFVDREDAGRRLAEALSSYRRIKNVVVVALPRGGVVLGRVVADFLGAPLDLVVPRKIGASGNEEYAIGAITEEGDAVWNEAERALADTDYLRREVQKQQAEARRRLGLYRAGMPLRDLKDKTVIIVDDGIATGYTMRAAVNTVKAAGAARIVVAVPVSPPDSVGVLRTTVDKVVVLETPRLFLAIGAFYDQFGQVDDETVTALMKPNKH
jgi:predicted phosphoribosyltransferase